MEIKKEALEKLIQESIDEMNASPGFFCEDLFAIHIGDGFEVQVVVTTEEQNFVGAVPNELEG